MKRISERLMKRNYPKRLLAIFLAAVFLLAVTAVLVPVTMRRQIAELRAWKEAREAQEQQDESLDPAAPAEGEKSGKRDGKEKELKAALRSLTPIGKGVKVAFATAVPRAFSASRLRGDPTSSTANVNSAPSAWRGRSRGGAVSR
ncbi:MAG TPA: hypothetical protein DDW30_02440 [Clostridiales bacterium]|nr:hypothetical protein [Clostridiales bacterium]